MEERETRKVVLWLVDESPKARKFLTLPIGGKEVWIPRSITPHVSKNPITPSFGEASDKKLVQCIVDVEEWFLDKNGL